MFEDRECGLNREVVYYTGLPGQSEEKETTYEDNIPTGTEGPGNDQYDNKGSSDVFIGPASEGDFMRLWRDFCQKYGKH